MDSEQDTGEAVAVTGQLISVILPVFNEEESIRILFDELFEVLDDLGCSFEVLAVDDGSADSSFAELNRCAELRPEFRVVRLLRNYGQTAALMAGIRYAKGDILIPMDADLQNDPKDIPRLIEKLDEGFDVVSGWRVDRKDSRFRRILLSRVANRIISRVSGVKLHDYGCTLKAYRRAVIKDVRLLGEMHRFIPIYAFWQGARVTELPVNHRPRSYGASKYGMGRVFKVMLDLFLVRFMHKYFGNPIYIFGGFGFVSILFAFLSMLVMLYLRIFEGIFFVLTPLPLLAVMLLLVGIISILMGVLAEILVRIYYATPGHDQYLVADMVNLNSDS